MNNLRKRIAFLAWLVFLFILPSLAAAQSGQAKRIVMIDAAHGGSDSGVVVTEKIQEKDITLALALLVQKELAKSPGVQVQMIRKTDKTVSTAERLKILKAMPAEGLFISFHVNAGFGKNASGYEVYFPGFKSSPETVGDSKAIIKDMTKNKNLNDSVRFAQIIQKNMDNIFPRKGRGLRDAPIPVMNDLNLTGVILEIGFATNPEDRKKITSEIMQRDIAQSLSRSIIDYF